MKLKFYPFILMLLCSISTLAQAPDWGWTKSVKGKDVDQSIRMTTDATGNIYFTGYFYRDTITFGNTTLINYGEGDAYVVKYTPNGNVLWAKNAIGYNCDMGKGIASDAAGNIYLTGDFCPGPITFGNITLDNTGNWDIFIVKYDSSGNVLWAKSAEGNNEDRSACITTDATGNVYLTGSFLSKTLTFDNTILTRTGQLDVFITKYDANGNVLWAKDAASNRDRKGTGITSDAMGNIYLIGNYYYDTITFGNIALTNTGQWDIFITKYDSNGNVLCAKSVGGCSSDEGTSITTDKTGNVYITGNFDSPTLTLGNITLTNSGFENIFIAKYDANSNVLWAKKAGGSLCDKSYGITTDTAGNIYLTGVFESPKISFGNITLTKIDGYDIFIVKYAPNGNVLWAKSVGGDGRDEGTSITTDKTGNVYITGNFDSPTLSFDNTTLVNTGMADIFIAQLNTSSNTIPEYPSESKISIYPNPADDELTITLPTYSAVNHTTLELFDIYGNLLKNVTVTGNTTTVDISGYPAGVYVVRFMNNEGVVAKRIVKR